MADGALKGSGGRRALVAAAITHASAQQHAGRAGEPIELEKLGLFAGAQPSLVSPERLTSAASIEARVHADRADACVAASALIAMDDELLRAKAWLEDLLGAKSEPDSGRFTTAWMDDVRAHD
ncbi:hypothetical protein KFE25_007754 [Diacronema lutheri]|uniref:Uncharacterized protein n=1 Tax=Diacronema lutheri TaxID=2081491 RepID=A0A8J6CFL1_DIALT|nr:hypothetical protein KFE25_007754 [Diacronema lutheri]